VSAPWHSRVAGLKAHACGLAITPSTNPSFASHAARTAAVIAGSFAGEIAAPGALNACAFQTKPALECDWKFQGAPTTTPSYSSGYRCISMSPWRPPFEQELK